MDSIPQNQPLAVAVIQAIQSGNIITLKTLLNKNQNLANSYIYDEAHDTKRSLLHIATDWPGHFPNVAETIKLLIEAGTNVNAIIEGPNTETPLHWAASSNDIAAIDALLDGGADLDAQGAVIAGGDPLEDAIGFQNWDAAQRLVLRGAKTTLGDEAALGLMEKIKERFEGDSFPSKGMIYLVN